MRNSQEAESDSSFYTTYSYEYDFLDADIGSASFVPFPKGFLAGFWLVAKFAVISSASFVWNFSTFAFFYLVFIQKRLVAFAYWLESIKDLAVKIMMWRRGMLFKPTIHGGILAISSAALVVGGLFSSSVTPKDFTRDSVIAAYNTTETIIPEGRPRSEVIKYKVEKGQTLSYVSKKFNVSVASIKWANNLSDVDKIKPGDTLAVPPVTGIVYTVKKSDTIASVAKKYRAHAQAIADYPFNYIGDSLKLRTGQKLIIPGGKKPEPTPLPAVTPSPSNQPTYYAAGGSGQFSWPAKGSINQTVSWWHPAIDIGASYGSPVRAAAGGTVRVVSFQGWGFGHHIVINHQNGYLTTYAHMGAIHVGVGKQVARGQLLGGVGCTGLCTGSHLHFEISRSGQSLNPLSLF